MKKVVLLGDSIRLIGYGPLVPAILGDGYTVWQSTDNDRFASYMLRNCFEYKAELETADVIHWNNGLWDMCDLFGDGPFTSKEDYVALLVRIAKILLSYCPKVIFCTTTPPRPAMWGHSIDRVREYNAAAVEALVPLGVRINDLGAVVIADPEKYVSAVDNLHLNADGCKMAAGLVADAVKAALAE